MTIKSMINQIILVSLIFNRLLNICNHCDFDAHAQHITHLINTYFNASANNFTIVLNREEAGKQLTMKKVKERVSKNRPASDKKIKNINSDVSTWTHLLLVIFETTQCCCVWKCGFPIKKILIIKAFGNS